MADRLFKTGDTVVEPSIGICTIAGVKRMTVDGKENDYFILNPPSGSSKVYVPRDMMERRGVRAPMDKDHVRRLLTKIKTPIQVAREDARMQYLAYRDTMKSGDPNKISRLLRELYILDETDELKGKEKEILDQAKAFLVEEIVFVRGISKTKAAEQIDECLRAMLKDKQASEKKEAGKEKK
jgi:CarD family transcriptional regulator